MYASFSKRAVLPQPFLSAKYMVPRFVGHPEFLVACSPAVDFVVGQQKLLIFAAQRCPIQGGVARAFLKPRPTHPFQQTWSIGTNGIGGP
jgi:hypothetical protein